MHIQYYFLERATNLRKHKKVYESSNFTDVVLNFGVAVAESHSKHIF